ncbi:hypothetical protein [Lysinibacillus sphaericus]|nr:hypothetical protein [Lysinibacillus sphaericus]
MADSNIMKSTVIKKAHPLKVSQEMLFDDRIQVARPKCVLKPLRWPD